MEITGVDTHLVGRGSGHAVDRWLFVEVHTDTGLTGVGEAGTWGYLEATETAVETFARYLVGTDPRRREHHWNYLYRNSHFRGAVLMGALSALDVALWDVVGHHHGVPVADLLGGRTREAARVYVHAFGETTEDLAGEVAAAHEQGFTAVGHLSPLLDEGRDVPYFETHAELVTRATERVRRFREAVGPEVDLLLELHRRLDPEQAVVLTNAVAEFHPLFVEDPARPDSFDAMARVAAKVDVPIATGERLHTPQEFAMLLDRDAVQYARPNIHVAGGFTGLTKIAGLCEAHNVDLVPHNPLSPVTTAASLQLAAAIPNFAVQEFPYRPDHGEAPGDHLVEEAFVAEDGFLPVPDRPGIGITLDADAIAEEGYAPRPLETRLHRDGSVVDQ